MVGIQAILRIKRRPAKTILAPELKSATWQEVGCAEKYLRGELEVLYWDGVKNEIENIIQVLQVWQQPQNAAVQLPDEDDDFIHGFDTFVDQVSLENHEVAEKHGAVKERLMTSHSTSHTSESYLVALEKLLHSSTIKRQRTSLREALREKMMKGTSDVKSLDIVERRAKNLLQSASFLDVDKLVQYQSTTGVNMGEKKPMTAQLHVKKTNGFCGPVIVPLKCSECDNIIRGSMFRKWNENMATSKSIDTMICEDTYWSNHYGDPSYVKCHKNCTFQMQSLTQGVQKPCSCREHWQSATTNSTIHPRKQSDFKTWDSKKRKYVKVKPCRLLDVDDAMSRASFDSIHEGNRKSNMFAKDKLPRGIERLSCDSADILRTGGMESNSTSDGATPDCQMAIAIGPMVIEQGVGRSKNDILFTTRTQSLLPSSTKQQSDRRLALSTGASSTIWEQDYHVQRPMRLRAVMKQVVGTPFTGINNSDLENEIVRDVAQASSELGKEHKSDGDKKLDPLDQVVQCILTKLRRLLEPNLDRYLSSIVPASIRATANHTTPDGQRFCNSLLDHNIFGPLVDNSAQSSQPLYLFSFLTRPTTYSSSFHIKTKYSVPLGLTEEHLHSLNANRDIKSDIIDSLHEYYHDWAALEGTLYPHQDVFPWDCTESYNRYPMNCGDCNLSKHVWAFPFDSFSMITHHLMRERCLYAASSPESSSPLDDKEWMMNRLRVITARNKLLTGVAVMAQNPSFVQSTTWLHQHKDPSVERVKLGGIFRAQPFGHTFETEAKSLHHHFLAEWAHWDKKSRVTAYESMRARRVKMADVGVPPSAAKGEIGGWHNYARYAAGFGVLLLVDAGFVALAAEGYAGGGGPEGGNEGGGDGAVFNCGSGCGDTNADCGGGCGGCGGGCGGCG